MGQLLSFTRPPRITEVRPVQPALVADLLLAMEDTPLYRAAAVAGRDLSGLVFVGVKVNGQTWRLSAVEARLAADALEAELAFVGCLTDAQTLRDAAREADGLVLRRACGRPA